MLNGGTLVVNSSVIAGNGGTPGANSNGSGTRGAGGVGIVAGGQANITVGGQVSGGHGVQGLQADTVDLTGGGNTLTLETGWDFNSGNVVSDGSGDTLALGGSADSSFDLSLLGPDGSNEFQGFSSFDKNTTATWTLSDGSGFKGQTTISAGTLPLTTPDWTIPRSM